MKEIIILIFSDSHRNKQNITNAVNIHKGTYDYIFFLGDGIDDVLDLQGIFDNVPVIILRGNNDFMKTDYPSSLSTEISGRKIFMCHGHDYGVKSGLERLCAKAESEKADIVLYGHTHTQYYEYIPEQENIKPYHIFCPGSISSYNGAYGILEISDTGISLNKAKLL